MRFRLNYHALISPQKFQGQSPFLKRTLTLKFLWSNLGTVIQTETHFLNAFSASYEQSDDANIDFSALK